ncbi:MAG: hypothetical protein NC099_00305 [Corallococcus sp.]|nr:hypothetical protein [Corallococcus sp.]
MAKTKKKNNVMGFVLLALVSVALVIVVVGMFVGQVISTASSSLVGKSDSTVIKLFDPDAWKITTVGDNKIGVSNVFGIVSFVVTLAGIVILLLDAIFHYVLGKDLRIIRFIGVALTFVGAVLILVAGMVMAKQYGDYVNLDFGGIAKNTVSAGAGVWLGFIGGLIGAVGGGLGLMKKFD